MKRLLGMCVLVCGTLMALSPARAQEKKLDFSGVWTLDEQKTDLSDEAEIFKGTAHSSTADTAR
jgi:hypothetical protein